MPVLVTEEYRDWRPPVAGRRTVEHLLQQVPEMHLVGLRAVVLTNAGGLARRRRRARTWTRNRKIAIAAARGLYRGAWKGQPPWIELFVDRICDGFPRWAFRFALVRDLLFAEVLFHEVGHHIHATTQKEHADRELVAEKWREAIAGAYFRRRYWYLRPVTAVSRCLKRLDQLTPRSSGRASRAAHRDR